MQILLFVLQSSDPNKNLFAVEWYVTFNQDTQVTSSHYAIHHYSNLRNIGCRKRLTSKTFGAEVHGFTGPEETGENVNVMSNIQVNY